MRILLFDCDNRRPWLERRTRMRISRLAREKHLEPPEVGRLGTEVPPGPVWLLRAGASPLDLPAPLPPSQKLILAIGPQESFELACARELDHELFRHSSDLLPYFARVPVIDAARALRSVSSLYTTLPRNSCSQEALLEQLVERGRAKRARMFVHPGFAVRQSDDLRVAILVTTLHRGGAERVALDLHAHSPRCGVASLLFVLDASKRASFPVPMDTVPIHRLPKSERVARVLETTSDEGIDVVHAHLLSGEWLSHLSEADVPVVQTLHNAKEGWPEGIQNAPLDLSIACSRGVEQDWKRSGNGPVRTVWNGIAPRSRNALHMEVHLADRSALRQSRGISAKTRVLLSVANIRPQKRLEELPVILRGLLKRGIDAVLVLVGEKVSANDASENAERALVESIQREGVSERVFRVGSSDRVDEEYAAADVLVSSAWHEGLSLVHLEALQSGLPLVVRDAHGVLELRERHPDRVTVVGQDEGSEAMVDAIALRAGREEELANEWAKRSELSSSFSVDAMAEGTYRLLRSLSIVGRRGYAGDKPSGDKPSTAGGLLFVTNNLVTGGAQSSLKRLAFELHKRGHSVAIALLEEHPGHPSHGRRELESKGIVVHVVGPASKNSAEGIAFGLLQTAAAMGAESVTFWNAIAPVKVAFAEIGFSFRIFDVSPGEMYFRSLETFFQKPRGAVDSPRRYGALLSGVIVKYEREREEAARVLGTDVFVVPNGLPLAATKGTENVGTEEERLFVIGTVCRISPDKRIEELLDAFRLLLRRSPSRQLELHIVGGPDRHQEVYLESLKTSALDLPIRWLGEILPATECFQGFDLFAMISEPAGCPNASLEAMAAGLPIVATDHGGAAEQIVHGESGLLTPRADPRALADAIAQLAEDRALRERMGKAARARVKTHFSLDQMAEGYLALLTAQSPTGNVNANILAPAEAPLGSRVA